VRLSSHPFRLGAQKKQPGEGLTGLEQSKDGVRDGRTEHSNHLDCRHTSPRAERRFWSIVNSSQKLASADVAAMAESGVQSYRFMNKAGSPAGALMPCRA